MPRASRKRKLDIPAKSAKNVTFAHKLEQPTPDRSKRLSEDELVETLLGITEECKTRAQLTTALSTRPSLRRQIDSDMVTDVMREVFEENAVEVAVAKLRIKAVVGENLRFAQKQAKRDKLSKKFNIKEQDADHLAATFGAMAVALACTAKSKTAVDVAPLVTGPEDATCYKQTALVRLNEDGNVRDCHAARCAYNTGGSWFASVMGNKCMSCEAFLQQAHAEGRTDALAQFFWLTSLVASVETPDDVCVHGDQMIDLAMLLLEARGDGKAVTFGLGFDQGKYLKTMSNPVFVKSVTEKAGEMVTFKNAAILAGMAALVYGGWVLYTVPGAVSALQAGAASWGSWAIGGVASVATSAYQKLSDQLEFMMVGKAVDAATTGLALMPGEAARDHPTQGVSNRIHNKRRGSGARGKRVNK